MNNTQVLVVIGLLALATYLVKKKHFDTTVSTAIHSPTDDATLISSQRLQSLLMRTGIRVSPEAEINHDVPIELLIAELQGASYVIDAIYGEDALHFTAPLHDLIMNLQVTFAGQMHMNYDNLAPSQQALYLDIASLVNDVRALMRKIEGKQVDDLPVMAMPAVAA